MANDATGVFVYTGQPSSSIPKNVTHVIVDSTVRVISRETFCNCERLVDVQLNEGLTVIEKWAFQNTSLRSIVMPSTLKQIGRRAFEDCILANVQLNEGLLGIGFEAFAKNRALVRIRIPSTVRIINPGAFCRCPRLVAVEFDEEIEELVSETSLQVWWNQGINELVPQTFSALLVWKNLAERLARLRPTRRLWLAIDDMLGRIPSKCSIGWGHLAYIDSIDSKLVVFEKLEDVIPLLELALWKSKMIEQAFPSNGDTAAKMEHRFTCGANVIIPNVLAFIVG